MSDILDRLRAHRESVSDIAYEVPQWGLQCFLKPISASKHSSIVRADGKNHARMGARFIIATFVDEKGAPVFKDDAATLAELMEQPANLLSQIALDVVEALNMEPAEDDGKNS